MERWGRFVEIVRDELWGVERPIRLGPGIVLPARMTVLRLGPREVALHSPVEIDDDLARTIATFGEVTTLIAPNNLHHLFLRSAMERYPSAEVWAAPGLPEKRPRLSLPNVLGSGVVPGWSGVLTPFFLEGAPAVQETVFLHRPTRTLIVTDAWFNLREVTGWMSPFAFRLTGTWNKTSQSRLWRAFVKDRKAMASSTREVLSQDFDRVIVAHGEVIERGGPRILADAARWLIGDTASS